MLKICPICQKEFNSTPKRRKYCSDNCRIQSDYKRHVEWMERTNYVEKRRSRKEAERQEEIEKHRAYLQKQHEEQIKKIEAEEKREQEELKKRAAAGDYEALMETATDSVTYYKYFALAEIEREERDFGRRSTREINGISVYEPDFAERVVKSIEETGHCFSRSHGLGAKIDT